MWVDRMLDPHCDFELWPHPWPWPLMFKVKFWKSRNSEMGCPIDMKKKLWVDWMLDPCCDFQLWPWPWISSFKFWNSCIPGMGGPINMERKVFIKNVVAVDAYSRLASRSQAKFHTKKLSPLVCPCAAAPAQSTTSAHRSLRFSPR